MPYAAREEVYVVKREIAAMKAMKGKSHVVRLLSEDTHDVDGVTKKFVVMRYLSSCDCHDSDKMHLCIVSY